MRKVSEERDLKVGCDMYFCPSEEEGRGIEGGAGAEPRGRSGFTWAGAWPPSPVWVNGIARKGS